MFKVMTEQQTSEYVRNNCTGKGFCGEMRKQFSSMSFGESFIYPMSADDDRITIRDKIKGTCRTIGVKVSTKISTEGLVVIYVGRL